MTNKRKALIAIQTALSIVAVMGFIVALFFLDGDRWWFLVGVCAALVGMMITIYDIVRRHNRQSTRK